MEIDINKIIKQAKEFIAKGKKKKFNALQNDIAQSGDAYKIYRFARDVAGADIEKLEDAMIQTDDFDLVCWFAADVQGADIVKFEDAAINSGDAFNIYYFAECVKRANIEKLWNALQATNDSFFIKEFKERFISSITETTAEEQAEDVKKDDFIDLD